MPEEVGKHSNTDESKVRVFRRGWQIADSGNLPKIGESTSLILSYSEEMTRLFRAESKSVFSGTVARPWTNWRQIRDSAGASTAPKGRADSSAPAVLEDGPLKIFFVSDLPVPERITLTGVIAEGTPGLDTPIDAPITTGIITKLLIVRMSLRKYEISSETHSREIPVPETEEITEVQQISPEFITGINSSNYSEDQLRKYEIGALIEMNVNAGPYESRAQH